MPGRTVDSGFTASHKLVCYHQVDKGGHFASWEQPDLFATEIRAACKSPR